MGTIKKSSTISIKKLLLALVIGVFSISTFCTGKVMASTPAEAEETTTTVTTVTTTTTTDETATENNNIIAIAQAAIESVRADGMPTDLIGDNGVVKKVTNIILSLVGLVAVFMIIYGGIRYIISAGDAKKVTDAKNTILYAIIGLIICILSYAIVNFVLATISGMSS